MPTPLFTTHHAPLGSWTSLTFGTPNQGAAIDREALSSQPNADLLVALHRGHQTTALPFIQSAFPTWSRIDEGDLTRELTPCIDEFRAPGITLRIFTPHAALPNPRRSGNLQYATVPGLLLELTLDNSNSDEPATGFIGINSRGAGRLRPADWSSKALAGIAHAARWLLAASAIKDQVFTLQSSKLEEQLAAGLPAIDPTADAGGIAFKVPPRTTKTLDLAFAFFESGSATQGIETRYLYASHFPRIEAAAYFILQNSHKIRESCTSFDARSLAACPDPSKLAIFSQAVHAYDAASQLTEAPELPGVGGGNGPSAFFTSITPITGHRSPLDRIVDQLPWEISRNPWVIRNVFDLATSAYAYHDRIRFPSDAQAPEEWRDGGMTFVHDFGLASAFAPAITKSSDGSIGSGIGPGWWGGSLATENLLNAIYLLTSYALMADDTPWSKTRLPFARELMLSMENRDHWDPAQRNGILKSESLSAAPCPESTTFLGLNPLLALARGNLYLAIKTFCANLMLTTYYQNNNDLHSADYSYAFAQRTAQALIAAFDKNTGLLPANLLTPDPTHARMLVALEPLAVPTYLGLTSTLAQYFPELFTILKFHAESCLKNSPEGCVDPTGTLRLVSTSPDTLPAKLINTLFVLERLFHIDIPTQFPTLWPSLLQTAQTTPGDPRLITSALFLKPAPTPT